VNKKIDRGFARKLRGEIETWEEEGLVSPIQKDQILAYYRMKARSAGPAGTGRLITALSVLGSVLAGVGVILFVAANWSAIPAGGKLVIIFLPMAASYGLGYLLRYERGDFPRVGAGLILLGALIFGAGIFLIAQIYHLPVHFANGPLVWGLGVLPLAYLLRFKTLLSLSLIVLLIWLGMETHSWLSPEAFEPSGPIPGESKFVSLYFIAGLALWGLGLMHRGHESFQKISGPYFVLGMLCTFGTGFLFTFDLYGGRFGIPVLWPFYLALSGLFLLSLFGLALSYDKPAAWVWEMVFLLVLLGLALYMSLLFDGLPGMRHRDYVLAANLIFVLAVLIVLFLGYVREFPVYVNIALLFFVLDLVVRYFDFFWELLPRSLFFIIGGFFLLTGGVLLERKRRKILGSFRKPQDED
jgi:uncharacterized membrane protein